jgi:uncharacterized protein
MSKETMVKILKLIASREEDTVKITLRGGEPFLAFDLMKTVPHIWSEVSHNNKKMIMNQITTNGTLLNKESIDFLKINNIRIRISLDGYDYESNRRRFRSDKNLFKSVKTNIQTYAKKMGSLPDIMMTVPLENIKSLEKNVTNFIKNGFRNISIRPVEGIMWSENDRDLFCDNFRSVVELHKRLREKGIMVTLHPIDKYLRQITRGEHGRMVFMIAETVTFAPSGDAFACQLFNVMPEGKERQLCLGSSDTGINHQKLQKFRDLKICDKSFSKKEYGFIFGNEKCARICKLFFSWIGEDSGEKLMRNALITKNHMFKEVYKTYFKK